MMLLRCRVHLAMPHGGGVCVSVASVMSPGVGDDRGHASAKHANHRDTHQHNRAPTVPILGLKNIPVDLANVVAICWT